MLTTSTILLLSSLLSLTSALPTGTSTSSAPKTTHTVVAGRGGDSPLRFDPDNIVAEVGSIIEFHFLPVNHSVVESSFSSPCIPKSPTSFFSGFFPVPAPAPGAPPTQSNEVFQIEVKDAKPIWFYCAQGKHCQNGMVGVVNQNFDNQEFSLRRHRELAKGVQGPAGVPGVVQGGWRGVNPNPQSGV